MEKTTMGLLAALGALAATPASASLNAVSTENILKPASLAELLDPVPNAVEVMKALRDEDALAPVELADTQISIGVPGVMVRHHHHHHHRIIVRHHHHHHHHHHNTY